MIYLDWLDHKNKEEKQRLNS